MNAGRDAADPSRPADQYHRSRTALPHRDAGVKDRREDELLPFDGILCQEGKEKSVARWQQSTVTVNRFGKR